MDPRQEYFLSEIIQRWKMRGEAGDVLNEEDRCLYLEWNMFTRLRSGEKRLAPGSLPFDLSSFLDDWVTPDESTMEDFDHGQLIMSFNPDNVEVVVESYTRKGDIKDVYRKDYTYQQAEELLRKLMKNRYNIYDCFAETVFFN